MIGKKQIQQNVKKWICKYNERKITYVVYYSEDEVERNRAFRREAMAGDDE